MIAGMGRLRDDVQAFAMQERYEAGLSFSEVAAEFGCSRQSVYVIFKRRNWPTRPRPAALPPVMFNGAKYTLRNTGYFGKTTGGRTLLHRDLWEHHNGPIPDGYDIHHIDHDRTNNELSNLELIDRGEHARRHNLERH